MRGSASRSKINQAPSQVPQPLEKDVQRACEDLLQYDGWRIFRLEQNYSERKRKRVGEVGAPDCMAVRYYLETTRVSLLFVEWKRAKGIASASQKLWHQAERKRGAVTWIAGEQFEPTYDGFKQFYEASGLCRRWLK